MKYQTINSFDFDGVISIGIYPGPLDVIITGRCTDEMEYVLDFLRKRGINNLVFFNPMTLAERGNHSVEARTLSGEHKANTLQKLNQAGYCIQYHFEDDEIQQEIIETSQSKVKVIKIDSPTEK